jgi:hypothetical protein
MKRKFPLSALVLLSYCYLFAQENPSPATPAGGGAQALADKLSNPVASLISVPLQNNTDYGIGAHNGSKNTLNIQPVIPIKLSDKLNLITRYIFPVVDQRDITGEKTHQTGLSDATLTAFFAPTNSKNGIIWGAGPALLVPTGTDDLLSTRKWGVGPSALILRQANGLTYGFLVNQIWSFAGDKDRSDINQMFFQPFFVKNFKSGAGLGLNAEITSDWQHQTTTVFLNPSVTGVTKLGTQIVSLGLGPRICLSAPYGSRPDFGIRAVLTFVFPK